MRALLGRIWAATLWATPIRPEDLRYRHSKRVYIPLYYVLVIVAGVTAVHGGVPTIEFYFPDSVADLVALLFSVCGGLALVGLAWPRLWRLEAYSTSIILGLLASYACALIVRSLTGVDGSARSFVGMLTIAALWLPLMRIDVLGTEQRIRRVARAIDGAEEAARA